MSPETHTDLCICKYQWHWPHIKKPDDSRPPRRPTPCPFGPFSVTFDHICHCFSLLELLCLFPIFPSCRCLPPHIWTLSLPSGLFHPSSLPSPFSLSWGSVWVFIWAWAGSREGGWSLVGPCWSLSPSTRWTSSHEPKDQRERRTDGCFCFFKQLQAGV